MALASSSLTLVPWVGRVGDADADRRWQLAPGGVDGVAERALQLMGHVDRLALVGTGQGDDELVAADAPGDAVGPDAPVDSIGDDAQEVVATTMAERVVDRLEAVEIEEQDTDRLLCGCRGDERFQRLEHASPVEQSGERVVRCLMGQLFDGAGQLGVGLGQLGLIVGDLGEQILGGLLHEDRRAHRLRQSRMDAGERAGVEHPQQAQAREAGCRSPSPG